MGVLRLKFSDYQKKSSETAVYPQEIGLAYVGLGLVGEAGELSNIIKKVYRDDNGVLTEAKRTKLIDELSDCLWYIAQMAVQLDVDLDVVARHNLDKLLSRKERGKLQGSGDDR